MIFTEDPRDTKIDLTASNLLMAGVLLPPETVDYMSQLYQLDEIELAEQLVASRLLLDNYYEYNAFMRRN